MRLGVLILLVAVAGRAVTTQPSFRVDVPNPTADKPQSKLWFDQGSWWALLPGATAPTLWQRTGAGWIEHPTIRTALAGIAGHGDVWFDRDGATAVIVAGTTLAVIRLHSADSSPPTWRAERLASWTLATAGPIETATLARDSTGRWWIAAPVTSTDPATAASVAATSRGSPPKLGPARDIVVWTSVDAVTWQLLGPVATGVSGDDLCALAAFGARVGVVWSDQNRDEIGFRLRPAGFPAAWLPAEIVDAGRRTADDHLHTALGADGTFWVATKNSRDELNQPQLVLRVRSPAGQWRNLSYAPRVGGEEPSRPVVVALPGAGGVVLGHTVYRHRDRYLGRIDVARLAPEATPAQLDFQTVIAPDPALRSRINDITTPRQPYPANAPWIILASDAEGRVFEADLRTLLSPAGSP